MAICGALLERRRAGEPLQYVLGKWAFRTLELTVDPRALIPRPETEQVVEVALAVLRRRRPVVVDLGTGTGAIALSIAVERPDAQVWATDVDPGALALARTNRERVRARPVSYRQGSWFDALPDRLRGRVDLVVSNPPYVSEAEWAELDLEVRCEPYGALVAGPGSDGTPGLGAVEAVLRGSVEWLAAGAAWWRSNWRRTRRGRRWTWPGTPGSARSGWPPTWPAGTGPWWGGVRQPWPRVDAGQVVGIPTDTVYGLAARIDRPGALAGSSPLKGRPAGPGAARADRPVAPGAPGGGRVAARTPRCWPPGSGPAR